MGLTKRPVPRRVNNAGITRSSKKWRTRLEYMALVRRVDGTAYSGSRKGEPDHEPGVGRKEGTVSVMRAVMKDVMSDNRICTGTLVGTRTVPARVHDWRRMSWTALDVAKEKPCMPRQILTLPAVLITRAPLKCRVHVAGESI